MPANRKMMMTAMLTALLGLVRMTSLPRYTKKPVPMIRPKMSGINSKKIFI